MFHRRAKVIIKPANVIGGRRPPSNVRQTSSTEATKAEEELTKKPEEDVKKLEEKTVEEEKDIKVIIDKNDIKQEEQPDAEQPTMEQSDVTTVSSEESLDQVESQKNEQNEQEENKQFETTQKKKKKKKDKKYDINNSNIV